MLCYKSLYDSLIFTAFFYVMEHVAQSYHMIVKWEIRMTGADIKNEMLEAPVWSALESYEFYASEASVYVRQRRNLIFDETNSTLNQLYFAITSFRSVSLQYVNWSTHHPKLYWSELFSYPVEIGQTISKTANSQTGSSNRKFDRQLSVPFS